MLKKLSFFLFSFLFAVVSAQAATFTTPTLTSPVVDQAGILSSTVKARLEQTLISENQKGGPQVQVLTVSTLGDENIETAAIKVFDQWKLGDAKKDNGVLFLIAPNEKKLRIEVGYGLEGNIPDVIAKRIISDIVVPYFKRGEFDKGVIQGVNAILSYAHDSSHNFDEAPKVTSQRQESFLSKYIIFIMIGIWIILFFINPRFALLILSRGRGGGGFGSGGGWSGGGGSSGGGGASGGW